ncbi:hypothetical protein MHK03_09085 [Corynebacterium simulans]|uniref:hypothetical protein n=1 Tax=Corynebacterium simulans TaxID=146827 RepID=UPI001EF397BA|nr:hypothetical protein [Corynebacterium simulans]MCG7248074.1 hypothetical protein [Corynebacterium simulans]
MGVGIHRGFEPSPAGKREAQLFDALAERLVLFGELRLIKPPVGAFAGKQLGVGALLDDGA